MLGKGLPAAGTGILLSACAARFSRWRQGLAAIGGMDAHLG